MGFKAGVAQQLLLRSFSKFEAAATAATKRAEASQAAQAKKAPAKAAKPEEAPKPKAAEAPTYAEQGMRWRLLLWLRVDKELPNLAMRMLARQQS